MTRHSTAGSPYTAQVLTDLSELPPPELEILERGWNTLAHRHGSPLLTFEWFYEAARAFSDSLSLYTVVVRERDDICAIAPMIRRSNGGIPELAIVGNTELYEPSGLLYADEPALSFLLSVLRKTGALIDCSRIEETSALFARSSGVLPRRTSRIRLQTAASYFLELNSGWDEFQKKLSGNRRYDIRRKLKRASGLGEYRLEIHSPSDLDYGAVLATAMEVEDSGWKRESRSSMLQSPALKQFFLGYCERAAKNGILRIFLISIGNDAVAMTVAVESHGALWILKLGYREEFASVSPGMLITHESIRYAIEKGLDRYEFLGSSEDWQTSWPVEQRNYFTFLAIPWTSAGMGWVLSVIKTRIFEGVSQRIRVGNR